MKKFDPMQQNSLRKFATSYPLAVNSTFYSFRSARILIDHLLCARTELPLFCDGPFRENPQTAGHSFEVEFENCMRGGEKVVAIDEINAFLTQKTNGSNLPS